MENRRVKICTKCGSSKNRFYKDKSKKDGFASWCSICVLEKTRLYTDINREKIYAKNAERSAALTVDQKIAIKKSQEKYAFNNVDKIRRCKLDSYHRLKNDPLKKLMVSITNKRYSSEGRYIEYRRTLRNKNRNLCSIRKIKNDEESFKISMIYKLRNLLVSGGIKCEVDHIIPLNGRTVSGLHVSRNLQLLPKIENSKKGNRIIYENDKLMCIALDKLYHLPEIT